MSETAEVLGPQESINISRPPAFQRVQNYRGRFYALLAGALLSVSSANAGETSERELPRQEPTKGSLVIAGGAGIGKLPPEIHATFLEEAGGDNADIVIIPTASPTFDPDREDINVYWPADRQGKAKFTFLHARNSGEANKTEGFSECLKTATGVWYTGGEQGRLEAVYNNTLVQRKIKEVKARGGVVGGSSAGAAYMGENMIADVNKENGTLLMGIGSGTVEGIIFDQHLNRGRLWRLLIAVEMKAREGKYDIGIGIDEDTAYVQRKGGIPIVVGKRNITLCLPPSARGDKNIVVFEPGQQITWKTHDVTATAQVKAIK